MIHLWEIEHPYYCESADGGMERFASWAATRDYWDGYDGRLNLLMRWDWRRPSDDNDLDHETLELYFLLQRNGTMAGTTCPIHRQDEPDVWAWLEYRAGDLRRVWEPIVIGAAR